MHHPNSERHIVMFLFVITIATVWPIYGKLVVLHSARGVEVSWLLHLWLFAQAVFWGVVGLVVACVVLGVIVSAGAWMVSAALRLRRSLKASEREGTDVDRF